MKIRVGARNSPLSRVQVAEVLKELHSFHPEIIFDPLLVESKGDRDKKTSLRNLEKTNFFTEEIDNLLLSGEVHITIHSAKDLPEQLPKGLSIICLTKWIDPSDSLVLREGETLASLPAGAVIATSSVRREELVLQMRGDLRFVDLRGTIHERLTVLEKGSADGVVIAEAALIRLGLTHLNRISLPGETAAMQGKLAILAREGDTEMQSLFSCLDSRMLQR